MNRIVILGATSGIGLEIAKLYIAAGWPGSGPQVAAQKTSKHFGQRRRTG